MRSQRIIIVDDERPVRSGLSNLLQSEGYLTETFDSAEALLAVPETLDTSALLIIDIKLQGISGFALVEKLAQHAALPPVIYISGHGDENMHWYAMGTGALAFMRKPIHIDTLLDCIRQSLA